MTQNRLAVANCVMEHRDYNELYGTICSLMTKGAEELGQTVYEPDLEYDKVSKELEEGNILIYCMALSDFASTGHFIVVYGFNNGLVQVNNPNSSTNSKNEWNLTDK